MRLSEQTIATTVWISVDASSGLIEFETKSPQDDGVSLTHSDFRRLGHQTAGLAGPCMPPRSSRFPQQPEFGQGKEPPW